jgi:hypothetical protein
MFSRACVPAVAWLSAFCGAALAADVHTTESNFEYRLAIGGLGMPDGITVGSIEPSRAVRLSGDTADLLKTCQTDSNVWHIDPLWERLFHGSPRTTIGCREKTNPSLHVVFYKTRDGARETWAHFDTYGPGNPIFHAGEVFRNRLTFGHTSGYDVYRGLVRMKLQTNPEGELIPPPRYDFKENAKRYFWKAVSPTAIVIAGATGATSLAIRNEVLPGTTTQTYWDRIQTNLVRNAVLQSTEFTASAFLQQDETFRRSTKAGLGPRMGFALHRTFFVPGREGDEIAMPRIAAAITTPWILKTYHPGLAEPQDPWPQIGWLLGRYIAESYWTEFKPDIEAGLRKIFHLPRR